jgi:hypothetical protein
MPIQGAQHGSEKGFQIATCLKSEHRDEVEEDVEFGVEAASGKLPAA